MPHTTYSQNERQLTFRCVSATTGKPCKAAYTNKKGLSRCACYNQYSAFQQAPIIVVRHQIKRPDQPVTSTTKHDVEISIRESHMVSKHSHAVFFTGYEDDFLKIRKWMTRHTRSHITDRARPTQYTRPTHIYMEGSLSHLVNFATFSALTLNVKASLRHIRLYYREKPRNLAPVDSA